jgi:hypothetical protein
MTITLDIPEELPYQLDSIAQPIPEVLKLGIHELAARPKPGFTSFSAVLEFLANLHSKFTKC